MRSVVRILAAWSSPPPLMASLLRSAGTRSPRTSMTRVQPESPEGHVMTSAVRCLLVGKACREAQGGHG